MAIAAVLHHGKTIRQAAARDSQRQASAIVNYVGASYSLNRNLRNGEPLDERGQTIKDGLDRWFKSTKPESGIFYRGIPSHAPNDWVNLKPGQTITDKAFGSFSKDRQTATDFSSISGTKARPSVLIVARGKGYNIPYNVKDEFGRGFSEKMQLEREVLMPRNSTYRVRRVKDVSATLLTDITGRMRRAATGDTKTTYRVIYVDILDTTP